MTRTITLIVALALVAAAAEKSLRQQDLPPAVQKSIQEQAKGAEIKNIAKELEKGQTQYDVETIVNGKHRDITVDTKGAVIVVEEETSLDSIPAAAKATILKKSGEGNIVMIETVSMGIVTCY